ncbi:MAG: hypothetical protein IT285_14865 [Bdellovibrionales bacterium]|nr:hypothetical protein [Bdellovibrionales bacterium]
MRLLMVSPEHFDVTYGINPHMLAADGSLQRVDRSRAVQQWSRLLEVFRGIGVEVEVIPGAPGLPDMVFSANHGLPWGREVILSRMAHPERRAEVPIFRAWYEKEGYRVHDTFAAREMDFEGMGDALWLQPGKRLIGGFGFRTSAEVYRILGSEQGIETLSVRLISEHFYHLDTCLCLLREGEAAWVEEAFDAESAAAIRGAFTRLIPLDFREAKEGFAGNAYCPDGRHVVVQAGNERFNRALRSAGYEPVEVETGEFIKSGGSVFCMKMALG